MTLNELVTKQNILSALRVKEGEKELPRALKIKIVRLLMAYKKARTQMDEEIQEFAKNLIPEDIKTLQNKPEDKRTDEEKKTLEDAIKKANEDYTEFVNQKAAEEVNGTFDDTFTEEDFDEIIDINVGLETTINNQPVSSEELVEAFYNLFVNKK